MLSHAAICLRCVWIFCEYHINDISRFFEELEGYFIENVHNEELSLQ